MEYQDVLYGVGEIFKRVFGDRELHVKEATSAAEIAQWNSLNHVILISEVEKVFNIKFSLTDMLDITTVGDICNRILTLSTGHED